MDITESKRSEEALRASQMQLAEAMDLAHIVYWETDPIDNVFLFNDAFYAFYGTTAEREGGYRMTREEFTNGLYILTICFSSLNLWSRIRRDRIPNSLPALSTASFAAMAKSVMSWCEQVS